MFYHVTLLIRQTLITPCVFFMHFLDVVLDYDIAFPSAPPKNPKNSNNA